MAGYIGSKAVLLSTTAATVTGNSTIGGNLTVDTDTLFVDAANNRVGVGTSSPSAKLQVGTTVNSTALMLDGTNYSAGGQQVRVDFTNGGSTHVYSRIANESGAAAWSGEIVLATNPGTSQGSALVERMRIDSAGRVTMPYQPAFTAYSSTTTVHTTVGAFPLQNTALNIGNHYNTTTYNFTAPISGVYKFTLSALVQSGGHMSLLRNGSYVVGGSGGASGIHQVGTSYTQVCKEFIINLAANDAIAAYQENTNGVYRDWVVWTGALIG